MKKFRKIKLMIMLIFTISVLSGCDYTAEVTENLEELVKINNNTEIMQINMVPKDLSFVTVDVEYTLTYEDFTMTNVKSFEMGENEKIIKVKDLESDVEEFKGEPQITEAKAVKCTYRGTLDIITISIIVFVIAIVCLVFVGPIIIPCILMTMSLDLDDQ